MALRPIYDRAAFETKIAEATAASAPPLRVLRTMSLQPVPEGAVLAQRSALVITYTQPIGEDEYVYREVCLADEHGVIHLEQAPLYWETVRPRLEGDSAAGGPRVVLQHRSGSL